MSEAPSAPDQQLERALEGAARLPIREGRPCYGGELLPLFAALDARLVAELGAGFFEHSSGATVPRRILERVGFFEHIPSVPFGVHAMQVEGGALVEQELTEVLNPAACYHCFEHASALRGATPPLMLTSIAMCHRNEGSPRDPTRLRTFSMREFVLIGPRSLVEERAEHLLDRARALLSAWFQGLAIVGASDVFYGARGVATRKVQRARRIKQELVVDDVWPWPVAIGSRNLHNRTLLDAYDLFASGTDPTVSACVAFGLDRIILCLLAKHTGRTVATLTEQLRAGNP